MRTRAGALGVGCAILFRTTTAHADLIDDLHLGSGEIAIFGLVEVVAIVGGVVSAIGTYATLSETPPPSGWQASSFVFGSLNVVGATVMFVAAKTSHEPQPWLNIGIGQAGIAITDFVLGGIATAKASRDERSIRAVGSALTVTVPF